MRFSIGGGVGPLRGSQRIGVPRRAPRKASDKSVGEAWNALEPDAKDYAQAVWVTLGFGILTVILWFNDSGWCWVSGAFTILMGWVTLVLLVGLIGRSS